MLKLTKKGRAAVAELIAADASEPVEDTTVRAVEAKKFDTVVPLIKSESQQIVYGVVLTPELYDSQEDRVSAAEIEKAAHKWLVEYRKHDVQHNEQAAAIDPVESFIAPVDFKIEHETVLKGSWVMAAHVSDSETWERIEKGDITGFSIGGSGERIAE